MASGLEVSMFDVHNGRYGNITVQNAHEGTNNSPFVLVHADLILPKPEKCPYCIPDNGVYFIEGNGSERNAQYGLYSGKPARYIIRRKRYYCHSCRGTFFADHEDKDFNDKKHTLPEFIQFMIMEWVKNKTLSFRELAQKYEMIDEDAAAPGRSAESYRQWCNQIVDTFDSMTVCEAADNLFFSSFHYGINNPGLYCLVGKIVEDKSYICTFLENYDVFRDLKDTIASRFTNLSDVNFVVYDYLPGLNVEFDRIFKGTTICVDPARLKAYIKEKIKGEDRDYFDTLEKVFVRTDIQRYDKIILVDRLKGWRDTFVPYDYLLADQLEPLLVGTPKHLKASYHIIGNPVYNFEDITRHCETRSGKKERFENMKLRVLYDNPDFKEKIEKHIEDACREIYGSICVYCHLSSQDFSLFDFIDTLMDKRKYEALCDRADTPMAASFLKEYKHFTINTLFDSMQHLPRIPWSVPYFNLVSVLDSDTEGMD